MSLSLPLVLLIENKLNIEELSYAMVSFHQFKLYRQCPYLPGRTSEMWELAKFCRGALKHEYPLFAY